MKKTVKKRLVLKKHIKIFISKCLITIILVLIGLITIKQNIKYKNIIINNIYNRNIKFTKFKSLYQKYFGNILSIDNIIKEEKVFNEKITYTKKSKYKDGVVLNVNNNYMVPALESGIIIFVGEKDNYKTIIVEQINGIDVSYSNIEGTNIKLYDYIKKGQLLGECKSNKLYLTFQKEGNYLNYKDYL